MLIAGSLIYTQQPALIAGQRPPYALNNQCVSQSLLRSPSCVCTSVGTAEGVLGGVPGIRKGTGRQNPAHPAGGPGAALMLERTSPETSPPPLSQMQGVATGRDVIASAAGAALGRRCFYMDGRGGRSRCPKYLNTIPGRPGIPQVGK